MNQLLEIGLSNSAVAALLAGFAWLAARVGARPAFVHALWVLVLIKLVTPPLVTIEVFSTPPPAVARAVDSPPAALPAVAPVGADPWFADPLFAEPAVAAGAIPAAMPFGVDWTLALITVWLAGAVVVLLLAAADVRRLAFVARRAQRAPSGLQREVDRLAARIGLRHAPEVRLVPAKITPLVWAVGRRVRMLLPDDLMKSLSQHERATVLAHELAHLRRRDHWVRWFELGVRAAHWWNPIVWWACRGLRRAEEECCDAWVVWALPGASRDYADALLATVEFLADTDTAAPALASGMGRVQNLKWRLTMIMTNQTKRSASRWGRLALTGLALLVLPVLPAVGQDRPVHPGHEHEVDGTVRHQHPERHGVADDAVIDALRQGAEALARVGKMEQAKVLERLLVHHVAARDERADDAARAERHKRHRDATLSADRLLEVNEHAMMLKEQKLAWQDRLHELQARTHEAEREGDRERLAKFALEHEELAEAHRNLDREATEVDRMRARLEVEAGRSQEERFRQLENRVEQLTDVVERLARSLEQGGERRRSR